jgi:uncharacterized RDD family membrane protein YckC
MDKIKIPTSFNIELEFELADVMRRFLGWLMDLFVQIAYLMIVSQMLESYLAGTKNTDRNLPFMYNLNSVEILLYVPLLLYHLMSELLMNGQSIGKKIAGIRVISASGNRPSVYQFLLRWLIRPFDTYFFLLPALISMLVSKKIQRLGDLAAGTLVIKTRVKSSISNTVFFELEDSYQPRYTNVLRLSDRDMNIIKTILDTSRKQNNYSLAERTSDKIRTALNITEHQDPIEFLETILKDYNKLSELG